MFACLLLVASCVIGSSRVLSGCISLVGHKELKDVTLDSIRFFLLSDGANPCELFYTLAIITVHFIVINNIIFANSFLLYHKVYSYNVDVI